MLRAKFKELRDFSISSKAFLTILSFLFGGFDSTRLNLLPFLASDLHLSLSQVGILGSLPGIGGAIMLLPSAYLSVRLGAFRLTSIIFVGWAIFLIAIGAVSSWWALIILFFLVGVFGKALFPIGQAAIISESSKKSLGKDISNFQIASDVGKILLVTAVLAAVPFIGWRLALIASGLISIAVFASIFFKSFGSSKSIVSNRSRLAVYWLDTIRQRGFLLTAFTTFLDVFSSTPLTLFLPFLLISFGVTKASLWLFMSVYFIGYMAGKAIFGRMSDRWEAVKIFIFAEFFMVILVLILVVIDWPVFLLLPVLFLLGMVTRGTAPPRQVMIAQAVENVGRYEEAFTLNSLFGHISSVLSSASMGYAAQHYGLRTPFYLSALLAAMAIVPALVFWYREKRVPKPVCFNP
ncbi:MAG: MFS transporter [Patescibacteria group bacterium]|nr:MFS transporter [Patescibacteria group bacterium]